MTKSQLVVASNRGPLRFTSSEGGLKGVRGGGGLVSGFLDSLPGQDALWISTASDSPDISALNQGLWHLPNLNLTGVEIDGEVYSSAYDRVANEVLWFLYHGLFSLSTEPNFDLVFEGHFDRFRTFNRSFADAVAENSAPNASVIINDYHLALVPGLLARLRPDLKIIYFSHTPFPTPIEHRILPDHYASEILESLAGASRIGFHAKAWATNFIDTLKDYAIKVPEVFVAPLPSDPVSLTNQTLGEDVVKAKALLRSRNLPRPLILRVDRMELSKNIVRGFLAVEEMMVADPNTIGNFTFLALCYPSRGSLPAYSEYASAVLEIVERINRTYATSSWRPIHLETEDNFPRSLAALASFDVLLVNPVRDGLNLVAQEGISVNEEDGTVVLSRNAGAHELLKDVTIGINPFDISETAQAIYRAGFQMTKAERASLAKDGRATLSERSPKAWLADLLD